MMSYIAALPYLAFLLPLVVTGAVYMIGRFAGSKTNINSVLLVILAGLETMDFTWLPVGVVAPLATGLALSALLSNTLLTKRT